MTASSSTAFVSFQAPFGLALFCNSAWMPRCHIAISMLLPRARLYPSSCSSRCRRSAFCSVGILYVAIPVSELPMLWAAGLWGPLCHCTGERGQQIDSVLSTQYSIHTVPTSSLVLSSTPHSYSPTPAGILNRSECVLACAHGEWRSSC